MLNKRPLILLSVLFPLLVITALLITLRPPIAMAAPSGIIIVDTLLDESDGSCADGDCSLRDAIATSTTGDSINFNTSGTINLFSAPHFLGELVIDKSLTISSSMPIIISGNNAVRVFNVITGTLPINVVFDGLTIANGDVKTTDCGIYDGLMCGGGIMIQGSNITMIIMNSTLVNNAADVAGGVFNLGTLIINNSTISGNWATDSSGGIASMGTLMISSSTLSDNVSPSNGGGIFSTGMVTVVDSAFLRNSAYMGGGINHEGDDQLTISNSTFSDNVATEAGGAIANSGVAVIRNSTITNNRAGLAGGGISNHGSNISEPSTTIINTIIVDNTVYNNNIDRIDLATWSAPSYTFISGGHNLIGKIGSDITTFVNGINGDQTAVNDPKLSPLADNGGSTLTHALLPDSPALDTGAGCGLTDQRGVSRPQDGDDNGIAICDIGAYEYEYSPVNTCTTPIVVTSTLSSGASTLRQAISDVCDGGLITFDMPLTDQTIDISLGGELVISKSLTISSSMPITISGNNTTRVFNITSGNVTFDGLTIANGRVQTTDCGIYPSFCGGGIMIQNSGIVLTLTNSALISNTASNAGGGLTNFEGTLIIRNTIFRRNVADGGGGIFNHQGQIAISDVRFVNNSVYGGGGGLYNAQGVTEIKDSTFANNSAADGGGLYNYGTMTVSRSTLSGNVTFHAGGSTYNGGGGIHNAQGSLTINNSTLSDNESFNNGGGIYLYQGTVAINSSTLSGNAASDGGGLYNSFGTLHLQNTILANSTSSSDCFSGNALGTDINNLIEVNAGCGTPVSTANPLLGALQNNGGSTLTHALLASSPAIDAGDPTYPAQVGDYDQRGIGFDRVINGRLDIGSYELNHTCTTPIVVTSTLSSGAGTLRQAITDVCHGGLITFDAPLSNQTIDISPNGELVISKSVTISGTVPITISGNNAVRVFNVMTGTVPATNVIFDGLVIANGNVQTFDCGIWQGTLCGGGIMIQNSGVTVTVINSTLFDNNAINGGGISNHGMLLVSHSTFISNSADYGGGFSNYSRTAIDNTAFMHNIAHYGGGGILSDGEYGGMLTITNSRIFSNTAVDGGGIINISGILTVANSTIVGNIADDGGGIYNGYHGTLTITNSTLSSNSASWGYGGGIANRDGNVSINNSTIFDNSTTENGGGIYHATSTYGTVTINNSTLSGNSADVGGGVMVHFEGGGNFTGIMVMVNNSTITDNRVSTAGGGINGCSSSHQEDPYIVITNTIVSGNIISVTAVADDLALYSGSYCSNPTDNHFISGGYNLIGTVESDILAFTDGINGDQVGINNPIISPLTDNGGSTLTHALLPGSPAVDAGDPAYPVQMGDYEQRGEGFDRVINGRLDIGAYEVQDVYYSLTINIDGAGSVVCDGGCMEMYPEGTVVTLTAVSSTTSTSTGWSGAIVTTTNPISLTMDEAKALTATFALNTYDLSLAFAGTGSGSVNFDPPDNDCVTDCSQSYDHGTVVTLTAVSSTNSTFTGWSGAIVTTTNPISLTMDEAKAVTATFTLNTYDLSLTITGNEADSVNFNPFDIDCSADCTQSYDHGMVVTLTAVSSTNSTFTGWSGVIVTTTNPITLTMNENKYVTAVFEQIPSDCYSLSVTSIPANGGSAYASPVQNCVNGWISGTVVTLYANPNSGYGFYSWENHSPGFNPITITITSSLNINLFFEEQVELTVSLDGNGEGSVTSSPDGIWCSSAIPLCDWLFDYDTVVTLTAVSSINSTFTGWSGAIVTTTNSISMTMDEAKAVTATFTLNTYDLSLAIAGTGSGSVNFNPFDIDCSADCTQSYDHGTVVTLTAVSPITSTFTGWSGAIVSTDNPITMTMDAAKMVTATFNTYTVFLPIIIK